MVRTVLWEREGEGGNTPDARGKGTSPPKQLAQSRVQRGGLGELPPRLQRHALALPALDRWAALPRLALGRPPVQHGAASL